MGEGGEMNEYELIEEFFKVLDKLDWLTVEEKNNVATFVDEARMMRSKGAGKPIDFDEVKE